MDVSPSLRLDDLSRTDLFDFVSCADYDLGTTTLGGDWGSTLEDIVGRSVVSSNTSVTLGDVLAPSSWSYPTYTEAAMLDKSKDSGDKMWGGGGGSTERVLNSAMGNPIIITFPNTDSSPSSSAAGTAAGAASVASASASAVAPTPDTSDAAHNTSSSPSAPDHNNLDLFNSILNEKPYDGLVSQNHRSPASDCVSYVSATSAYSDSGISTTLDDTASPIAATQEHVDFDKLVDTAVESMVYSPGGGPGLPSMVDDTSLDGGTASYLGGGAAGGGNGSVQAPLTYLTPSTQSNDVSSILESALRGTVRRPGGPPGGAPCTSLHGVAKNDTKTLTLMTNMTPLPSLSSAPYKPDSLGMGGSAHISSSSNGVYVTSAYDYGGSPGEEFTKLDASFTKLSTAAPATTTKEGKPKKRKYTKRLPGDEPASKGRLLHFCHICTKGFKDKYSVNVHIRTHTGEKPFNCELCGKCFRQKAHLAKHIQIHSAPKPPNKR
ncbi:uncharacterized protein LOC143037172 [Oratosquilla oratoria]|uniref:uncharacterized protein LOC143037172 n=1 Tax=Oratosquilla oratoria TaxID=337810 RepID=UPI003F76E607